MTDHVQEFGDEGTEFETVFVLTDFDSPDYSYLYKRDNRIVGPPVVLHCAAKEEVSHTQHFYIKQKIWTMKSFSAWIHSIEIKLDF